MVWILAVLLSLPGAAFVWIRRTGWRNDEALRIGVLTFACLFISGPFINNGAIGTGEAANYSLAVADTVVQARAGTFPVYAGQSEYAFNGRMHPLRTAVYFTHVPAVLDQLTFRQLSFWGLQNLSLALSLWLAVFVIYGCLRRTEPGAPWLSVVLAGLFGLSPGLLAPAYGMDLYMTVTAAPFVALAVFGAARSFSRRDLASYCWMAVGLAGTWLAHPPVAAWTSLACGGIVAFSWLTRLPSLAAILNLSSAAVLAAILGGWAFASALSLREDIVDATSANLVSELVSSTTKTVGWSGLLPAKGGGTELGDYQLGYAGWALLIAAACVAFRRGMGVVRAMVALGLFLLVLTLPVPVIHERLWLAMPPTFGMLTNSWPMQRAYLVLAALAIFAFRHAWPHAGTVFAPGHPRRRQAWILSGLLLAWTAIQAWQFVGRGYHTRGIGTEIAAIHRSSNVDLTGIAYAFMPIPRQFYHGTRDPEQELRLLGRDARTELTSNQRAIGAGESVTAGTLRVADPTERMRKFEQTLVLEPGRRYRLTFDFKTGPLEGVLIFSGSQGLYRQYQLPGTATGIGFGMHPGNSRTLTLWTDGSDAEAVSIALVPADPSVALPEEFATFELTPYDRADLPLRLASLIPSLVIRAQIPEDGWLETPRMFVSGYQATVDGREVIPRRSVDGLTLVPVTAGSREINVEYLPSDLLRKSSLTTIAGWSLLFVVGAGFLIWRGLRPSSPRSAPVGRRSFLAITAIVGPALAGWILVPVARDRLLVATPEPGPLSLDLALPVDARGRAEPLASSGKGPGSATVFIRYLTESTVAFGIDVWGYGPRESAPQTVDYAQIQKINLTSGIFYDRDAKELSDKLGAEQIDWLQNRTQLWLNGQEVFFTHEAPRSHALEPFGVLRAVTGDGSYQHRFSGVALAKSWEPLANDLIPLPTVSQLANESGPIQLTLQLATTQIGQAEPILSIGSPENGTCIFLHYLDASHVRIGISGPGGDFVASEPIAVDYSQKVSLAISHQAFFPSGSSGLAGYSTAQRQQMLARTRIALNGRWVLAGKVGDPASSLAGPVRFGVNAVGATYPLPTFSGRFFGNGRLPADQWPIPPGNPEAATASGTAGPIELTARLPLEMTGRQQPLFVIGKPGEGTLVFVHYLDRDHIRIGVDVWNKALFWSQPIPTDYLVPQRIRIAMTSLFPENHPEVQALDPAARERLRNTLSVAVNDTVVINETIDAYDSVPEQMTPGRSDIGGSNHEAAFLGDILEVKRLPVLSP